MYTVAFRIDHEGCWASELSKTWPDASFSLRSSMPVQGHPRDILAVRAASAESLGRIGADLANHPRVREAFPLAQSGNVGFWMVVSQAEGGIIDVITRHDAFPHEPPKIVAGIESWTVGLASRERAKDMLDELASHGPLEVVSIREGTFDELVLTTMQARVIRAAMASGYYEFPRDTSPTQLAKSLGIAKSTLLEHLRRAEAKIILGSDWLA